MSDILEALQTLRENIREKGRTVQQIGIRDNDDTRNAIAVLLDSEAALQSQTAPAVPEKREWNQGCGRDDFKFTEGWNACRKAMLTAAPAPDHSPDAGKADPVAWAVFADNGNIRIWGRKKPESLSGAVPLYLSPAVKESLTVQSDPIGYADPDSLNDYRAGDRLHVPVYRPDASADWQDGVPVYLHPAPPSVAVPEGWKLVPIEPTEEMRKRAGLSRGADFYTISKVWDAMLTAAPSPAQSVEEIQAKALEEFGQGLIGQYDLIADGAEKRHFTQAGEWALRDAARLRASQQEGGEGHE